MRVASWAFVLCAVLVAAGVFLPSVELRFGGTALSKRTDLSLHAVSSDRKLLRRLLAAYHGSSHRKVGAKIVRAVAPKLAGRPRAALEDARDAMDTLDEVTDDDVKSAGIALTVALWTLIGLETVAVILVFGELMRGAFRRWRLVLALVVAALATAIAIALHLIAREAAWQANDEVGRHVVSLGPGAYLIPLAAIGGLLTAVVLVARRPAAPARTVKPRAR